MKKRDFLTALKSSLNIDERYELRFEKVQHDVKKGEFLIRLHSRLLPPEIYLSIEKYIGQTLGADARVAVLYSDVAKDDSERLCRHLRELCGVIKPALAPFLSRAVISIREDRLCVDFPDDFGRELFASAGLPAYLTGYLTRCFERKMTVVTGRCDPADAPLPQTGRSATPEPALQPAVKPPAKPKKAAEPAGKKEKEAAKKKPTAVIHGKAVTGDAIPIRSIDDMTGSCVIAGQVTGVDSFDIKKEMRGGKKSIVSFGVTDLTSTVTCKAFVSQDKADEIKTRLKKAQAVRVAGKAAYDNYAREICISVTSIEETTATRRMDDAETKRVELHMHTNMSALDGMADEADVVTRAAEFGHEAVAITDHGVVQAFPRAFDAARKHGIKVIYGMEAYLIDDTNDFYKESFADEYIVFDLETTGFNPQSCGITEIGAVRLRHGEIVDTFSTFVNPGEPISPQITDLTGITDAMVKDAPDAGEALTMFKAFAGDKPLAAHNAPFDMSFIEKHGADNGITFENSCLDTLWLIKRSFPGHKSYSLGKLSADFGIELRHHRALDDAMATAKLMQKCFDAADGPAERTLADEKTIQTNHIILLCRNATGLFNLYKLVTESHTRHFYRRPRVPKSLLIQHREGLIVGSACEQGELIQAILRYASDGELKHIARFYDYLEIQPDGNNAFMVREGRFKTMEGVRDITRRIVKLGDELGIPVAATCDAHFIEPQDEYFRRILMHGQKFADADNQAPLYYRTTAEMLAEFGYLGKEKAREVVIDNTRAIAAQVQSIQLLPDEPAMPVIEHAAKDLETMCWENARRQYGDPLPEIVEKRLGYELDNIIRHGYAVLYYIAYELVRHSLEDGYLVGSRGSVGSSLAATMAGITEVNGLPPHYVCPNCCWHSFEVDTAVYACGPDLPPKACPRCGTDCGRDGYDIPFATFLGINADKVPDIDLNFSGDYQPEAHRFILKYFGEERVFRAGTISSIKEQTAYGFVKGYLQEKNIVASRAEIDRLTKGVSGTKRTTGQHPGGLVILPAGRDIHEFTPVQYPANDPNAGSVTTHYNFNSLHDRLVKLDILGHDDPTALYMLHELTGIEPKQVPINDADTLSLFSSTRALGIEPEQILGCQVGSLGIPEFGTKFVRQMLVDTQPTTIGELVRIAGLSHGTDVWLNNAQELVMSKTATLREVICTRDDIMNYLVGRGMDATEAFYIMESVRKGKGLKADWEKDMRALDVPEWFIDSCKKIKYMFPRAHAVAYVMMSLRIAYFKVHHPRAFYATYFSVRADNLDAKYLHSGETVRQRIAAIEAQGKAASALEQAQLTVLEVALEMFERGIDFLPCDLYKSDATHCVVEAEGLRLPFTALGGTGESAAKGIVRAREQGEFLSVEDLKNRSGISSAVISRLDENGCLAGLLKSNQLSLFD